MAFTYGFYNSLRGDRKYNAEQVSEIFDGILKDGIIPSQGQLFDVNTANNGMQITVGTGRAWFNHTWSKNDSVMILTVPQSDITRDRFDTVVLEVNHEESVRANAIKIVSGVPAVNPVYPTLVNTDKVKQYPLAYVRVKAGTETILAENIENMVGRSPTVFATGVLETVAIDDLWSQWEGEWHTWFESIKLQLSGDIVTNLQYQIDQLKDKHENDYAYLLSIIDMLRSNTAMMTLTLVDSTGSPVSGFTVTNILDSSGNQVKTNANGTASGNVSISGATWSPTFQTYADIESYNFTPISGISAGGKYTIQVSLNYRTYISYGYSTSIRFSPKIQKIDFSIVGGGGGGGGCMAGGGGGGGVYNFYDQLVSADTSYPLSIGSGGSGGVYDEAKYQGTNGYSGGSTSFLGKSVSGGNGGTATLLYYPNTGGAGGSGGPGGGKGGDEYYTNNSTALVHGQNGSTPYINGYSTMSTYGPGGGGGTCDQVDIPYGRGGQIGGGNAAQKYNSSSYNGNAGVNGGGGGASTATGIGGRGGNGLVAIRMHH